MEFRYLKTLIAIADRRTFVAAGEAMGLTQSAVSLHMKALERELGTQLFDRSRRPPVLNAHGRTLVERARTIVDLCDRIGDGFARDELSGTLDLGAMGTSLTGVLPMALASLQASHASLRIRVTGGLSADLAAAVAKGELDAALVTEPTQLATGLRWHSVVREPLMVIAPAGTAGDTDRALLEARPFIRFKLHTWAGKLIDTHLRDRRINVNPGMEIDSLEAVSLMVSHGLGVSVVPERRVDAPFPPNIRKLPFGDPPLHRVVGLVERTSNPRAHLIKALYRELLRLCVAPDTPKSE